MNLGSTEKNGSKIKWRQRYQSVDNFFLLGLSVKEAAYNKYALY